MGTMFSVRAIFDNEPDAKAFRDLAWDDGRAISTTISRKAPGQPAEKTEPTRHRTIDAVALPRPPSATDTSAAVPRKPYVRPVNREQPRRGPRVVAGSKSTTTCVEIMEHRRKVLGPFTVKDMEAMVKHKTTSFSIRMLTGLDYLIAVGRAPNSRKKLYVFNPKAPEYVEYHEADGGTSLMQTILDMAEECGTFKLIDAARLLHDMGFCPTTASPLSSQLALAEFTSRIGDKGGHYKFEKQYRGERPLTQDVCLDIRRQNQHKETTS
jgi:hypothetical protein